MEWLASLLATTGYPLSATRGPAELLTPSEVRRLLADHELAPRRSSGQNFVVDPNTVRRIVAHAEIGPGDLVIEIGPGLGSLTVALAERARRVVAIEIDRGLVRALEDVLASRGSPIAERVEVVHEDALNLDLAALVERLTSDERSEETADTAGAAASPESDRWAPRVRVVANLPYNVATPLVMHALESGAVDDMLVMVQREVGERWTAEPGSRLRAGVSVKIDRMAIADIAMRIPRQVFYPVPNVDSVMVRLARRREPDPLLDEPDRRRRWFELIDAGFAQRRKTLRNAWSRSFDRDVLEQAARRAGVDLGSRAEVVTTDAFAAMFDALDGSRSSG
ncbi:MAG: 16S rRNA (adenine(1518)-N(6)/adenine(1519)-N(6))-dimethyltransferase RsmA [Nitriliruptoraceae bacterium]